MLCTIFIQSRTLTSKNYGNFQYKKDFKRFNILDSYYCKPYSGRVYDISITKGGVFKAVLGMKTALKVTLLPQGCKIHFEAGVGIWGQQAIPTIISMLFFWPVLITQIWGMVEQSKLDDKALEIAEKIVRDSSANASASSYNRFCTNCGTPIDLQAKFCPECGAKL